MATKAPWNTDRAREIIAVHAEREGAALPILHALQAEFGCVPLEAEPLVASALNLSRAEVHGIVTFYHEFRRTPPGRHVVRLCRAEACQAVGAGRCRPGDRLADHDEGAASGHVAPDGHLAGAPRPGGT